MSNERVPTKMKVVRTRTVHTYAELWHASDCVLTAGISNEIGSTWQFLSSIVLTAFTFEAYLNHTGAQEFTCWSAIEPLSPPAKFELLCEKLSVVFPGGKDARPLQTLHSLQKFRNTMAHGKTETVGPITSIRDVTDQWDAVGEMPLTHWQRLCKDKNFAEMARADVEEVLVKLHAARADPKEGLFDFGPGGGSATLIEESSPLPDM